MHDPKLQEVESNDSLNTSDEEHGEVMPDPDCVQEDSMEDDDSAIKIGGIFEPRVITTPADKIKCYFIEIRQNLRSALSNCNELVRRYGDTSEAREKIQLLSTGLKDLRLTLERMKICVSQKEIPLFQLDVDKLEKNIDEIQVRVTEPIENEGMRKTRSMYSSHHVEDTSDSSDTDLESDDSPQQGEHNSTNGKKLRSRKKQKSKISESDGDDSSETGSSDWSNCVDEPRTTKRRRSQAIRKQDFENDDTTDSGDAMPNGKVRNSGKKRRFSGSASELEDVCLACGTEKNIGAKHPLFIGGLCEEHEVLCHEKIFEYDEDGYGSSCCICFMGYKLVICDVPDCGRCYCKDCLSKFISHRFFDVAANSEHWTCNFCKGTEDGLLQKRTEWQEEIQSLFQSIEPQYPTFPVLPPISNCEKKPIRVLSLFDGIATGIVALKQLGFQIGRFVASEVDENAIRLVKNKHSEVIHVGDITKLTDDKIYELGPFDLLLGGSPCNDLSAVNPRRKGLIDADGTGCLFFDYYRILRTIEPPRENGLHQKRPFFWLFENVASMKNIDKQRISRFLQCEPRLADARYVSAASRPRLFWGNLPRLMDRKLKPGKDDRLTVQECLESGRVALVEKLNTITSQFSSLYQGRAKRAPVMHNDEEDVLWTTEVERVFGVPEHYSDVNNLDPHQRVALLGRSWSVPVIKLLLAPLKDYFKCGDN